MKNVKKSRILLCFGVSLVLIVLLSYTAVFMRDTGTVEACLAYPYASESKIERAENQTAEYNNCVAYLSAQNADGIQEMYLLKKKCWLNFLDVQRYVVMKHEASPMEKVGFFPTLTPSNFQENSIDWYFYSQNDLQIAAMICTFNTSGGAQVTQQFSCNPSEPFVGCVPEMQGNQRLESMVGYNQNGEVVYDFNTGLFPST